MTSAPFNVCAVFGERRRQKSALQYAADLARILGAEQLHVYLPRPAAVAAMPAVADRSAQAVQDERIARFVAELMGNAIPVVVHSDVDLATAKPEQLPSNPIVVSSELAIHRSDLNILQPFEEVAVRPTPGGVLVPFGDGNAGLISAAAAVPLARALGLEVVFYHTTWPAQGQTSANPVDHLYCASRTQHDRLAAMAADAGVQFRMEIEMADDVVMGMLSCALNGSISPDKACPVRLVVMSHGVNTCIGSYVEKTLIRSSTPVLVVAASPAQTNEGGAQ